MPTILPRAIVCDLDGTLAESKQPIDSEMAELISRILTRSHFSVLGGGKSELFFTQVTGPLAEVGTEHFHRLGLFPTSGARGYTYAHGVWKQSYAELLTPTDIEKIFNAFTEAFAETGYAHPDELFGPVLEDRGTAVVFSAAGQHAPVTVKETWHTHHDVRHTLREFLASQLHEFEVKLGGLTSIDVTRKGIDKAYGIQKIKEIFGLETDAIVFIGDALFPGGNDEPVRSTGITCLPVKSPEDTKVIFKTWLSAAA